MDNNQTIEVVVTDTGRKMDLVILDYSPKRIRVVVGEGIHNTPVTLTPTKSGYSFAGNVMGRELIYMKSVKDVEEEIAQAQHKVKGRRR